jgi:hypothetical protein
MGELTGMSIGGAAADGGADLMITHSFQSSRQASLSALTE